MMVSISKCWLYQIELVNELLDDIKWDIYCRCIDGVVNIICKLCVINY